MTLMPDPALDRFRAYFEPVPHRPTGQDLFDSMTDAEQDTQYGKAVADALRAGDITLKDLIGTSPQRKGDDYITQEPLKDT